MLIFLLIYKIIIRQYFLGRRLCRSILFLKIQNARYALTRIMKKQNPPNVSARPKPGPGFCNVMCLCSMI